MFKERSGSLGSMITTAMPSQTKRLSVDSEIETKTMEFHNQEDSQKLIKDLRQKTRTQAQQILAWRKAFRAQELLINRLQREKSDQLKSLSSKLLLFESRLIRKQKDISTMLNVRETIIYRQQSIIENLTQRLLDNGLEVPQTDLTELDSNILDMDSLNDSDSAVVMEDVDSDAGFPKFRVNDVGGVTVVRSVSDAIDPNFKYTSMCRRSNGFLRRPEILETVYSVEEDGDNDSDGKSEANKRRDAFAKCSEKAIVEPQPEGQSKPDVATPWPYSKDNQPDDEKIQEKTNHVTTYNRVMSNHRSVTKPKDVKYKRINKAKSKSLEELRGRLKNWVEQGSKLTGLALEHSQSYA